MKQSNHYLYAMAFSLFLASMSSFAQPTDQGSRGQGGGPGSGSGGGPGHAHLEQLTATLQLDPEQVEQLEALMENSRELHRATSRDDIETHCAIQAEEEFQLIEILNESQISSYEEMKNSRSSRSGSRGGPGPMNCD